MAILTFPSITPDTLEFGIKYNTQISTTSLTGAITTIELPGARWKGSMSFRDLTLAESAELKAFLMELRGMSGRFFFGDLSHTSPFASVTGTLEIESGSSARLLKVSYHSAAHLAAGDYIQVGDDDNRELKMIVGETEDSDPLWYLIIEPMMRRIDYEDEDAIYTNPKGVFMLDSDEQANWALRSKALLSDINISFIEA